MGAHKRRRGGVYTEVVAGRSMHEGVNQDKGHVGKQKPKRSKPVSQTNCRQWQRNWWDYETDLREAPTNSGVEDKKNFTSELKEKPITVFMQCTQAVKPLKTDVLRLSPTVAMLVGQLPESMNLLDELRNLNAENETLKWQFILVKASKAAVDADLELEMTLSTTVANQHWEIDVLKGDAAVCTINSRGLQPGQWARKR